MLPKFASNLLDVRRGIFTNASLIFTDTSPGGSFEMNPPPQFTSTADLKVANRFATAAAPGSGNTHLISTGTGRKYAEMIAANSQLIHFRCGVPSFNSITGFFTSFFDGKAAYLSKTGRSPGFFYNLGRAAGFIVTIPLLPLLAIGAAVRFAINKPSNKFYYMKPTMPMYWYAVNTIANAIAVNMGIVPRVFSGGDGGHEAGGNKLNPEESEYNQGAWNDDGGNPTADDWEYYHRLMPDVFRKKGGIDVYALSTRVQRLNNAARKREIEMGESFSGNLDAFKQHLRSHTGDGGVTEGASDTPEGLTMPNSPMTGGKDSALDAYIERWLSNSASTPVSEKEDPVERGSWLSNFLEFASAEVEDGGQFVTFRVNHTGATSESFGNSTAQTGIQQSINGTSADMRSKTIDLMGGNIGDGPVATFLETVANSVKDVAYGVLDQLNISGFRALMGSAFVDIPEVWQDSFATLPTMSYTMELRSWSGDPLSRLLSLWLPVACLLPLVLPKSTGRHSYDSPFLVEMYDKGRSQTRLGLVTSLQISRGEGNLGFTREGHPLGVNVSIEIKDLSSIMHMPINPAPGLFDPDSAYSDYMAILGSLGMADQIYVFRRLKLNITRKMQQFQTWTSPARWASMAGQLPPMRLYSMITREADRIQ